MTTLEQTISLERLDDLLNRLAARLDNLNLTPEEARARLKEYALALVPQLDADAKLYVKSLYSEAAYWFRPDWTPEKFRNETANFTDAERCRVALMTRDIPLISWFVNARAGRKCNDGFITLEAAVSQRDINESEVKEIRDAIEDRNSAEFIDALSDTLLTTAGFAGHVELNLTQNFVEMVDANFTRIAGNMEDAIKTRDHWMAKGVPCHIKETDMGTFPVLVTKDITVGTDQNSVFYPANKFLKKFGFRDAVPSQEIKFLAEADVSKSTDTDAQ